MVELLTAIISGYSSDITGLKTATTGMFSRNMAPRDTSGVYITVSCPVTVTTDYSEDSDYENITVDFNVWETNTSPKGVMDVGRLVKTKYVDNMITVTGYYTIRADKIDERDLGDNDKGQHYVVSIRYLLQTQ